MTLVDACAAFALVAMLFYAVLGGADFGGGFFYLATIGARSRERRKAIAEAMAPVWEANHVFLVLVVVVFFTAFPRAYAAYATALAVPLRVAIVAIAIRGVAFVFRAFASRPFRALAGVAFGVASIVAPFVLGASVGAISSGELHVDAAGGFVDTGSWRSPIALAAGATAVAISIHLAAVFLAFETTGMLRSDFRLRALITHLVVGAVAMVTLLVVRLDAPHLYAALGSPLGLVPLVVGSSGWAISFVALLRRRTGVCRIATITSVTALLVGWAMAQHPYLIYPDVTLASAAAPAPMLRFLVWSMPFGFAIAGPSMVLAFHVFKSRPRRIRDEMGIEAPSDDPPGAA